MFISDPFTAMATQYDTKEVRAFGWLFSQNLLEVIIIVQNDNFVNGKFRKQKISLIIG
jgi:hypothetical protein